MALEKFFMEDRQTAKKIFSPDIFYSVANLMNINQNFFQGLICDLNKKFAMNM